MLYILESSNKWNYRAILSTIERLPSSQKSKKLGHYELSVQFSEGPLSDLYSNTLQSIDTSPLPDPE